MEQDSRKIIKPEGSRTASASSRTKRGKGVVSSIVTGDLILKLKRWYMLALYCFLLMFLFTLHHFYHQNLQRDRIRLELELNRDRSRAAVFSSMRLNNSRPSYIMEQVKERGIPLEESQQPPKKLIKYE